MSRADVLRGLGLTPARAARLPRGYDLTITEAAALMGVTVGAVRHRVRALGLPAIRAGVGPRAPLRFSAAACVQWVCENSGGAA